MYFSNKAYEICLQVELNVSGHSNKVARRNSRLNFTRAKHLASKVIRWSKNYSKNDLKILNLSGINAGQNELGISQILKDNNISIKEWKAYDSDKNEFIKNKWLKKYFKKYGINLKTHDFNKKLEISGKYDVVLLSDVIEHLTYNSALNLIKLSKESLKENGLLLITVPNPFSLSCRLSTILGQDQWFDLKINNHILDNYYGHINIYSHQRIKAIGQSFRLNLIESYSFHHWRYTFKDNFIKYFCQKLINFFSFLIPYSRFTLFMIFEKNNEN